MALSGGGRYGEQLRLEGRREDENVEWRVS